MRVTERVLSLHPAAITAIFVALFVGGGLAMNVASFGSKAGSFVFSASMLALLAPLMFWHYSLYRVASDGGASPVGHNGRRAIFFLLALVGLAGVLVFYPVIYFSEPYSPAQSLFIKAAGVSLVVGNLSYFASIWAAANALTRFDKRTKAAAFHETLGTFFLELYLPIGIWVIYPRIKRMLSEAPPN